MRNKRVSCFISSSQQKSYRSVLWWCVARALNLIELGFNIQNLRLDWALGSDPCFPVPWRGVTCNMEGMVTSL
jgi:hypothetical protein